MRHVASSGKFLGLCMLAVFGATACGTTGPEKGADVEDVAEDNYFGGTKFVGEKVTLSAEVGEVLTPKSFTLEAENWGDDSVLVVSAGSVDLGEDEAVKVTGTVRKFAYEDYVDDYGLGEAGLYEPFASEEFLVAKSIDPSPSGQ